MEMPINTSAGRERREIGNGLEYDFCTALGTQKQS